jgi:hypothetical protein
MNEKDIKKGLEFRPLEPDMFREFARRHATSDEIGPIATYLDNDGKAKENSDKINLMGLWGCDEPCAAICCLVTEAKDGQSAAIKLDSIIVDKSLRRQGLGIALVVKSFQELISENQPGIRNLYAHSVHPATVRMLRSLGFNDPLPTGAPISSINLEEKGDIFNNRCNERLTTITNNLKLNCSYCRSNHRKTRHWCSTARKPSFSR